MTAEYTKLFDPEHVERIRGSREFGDRRNRPVYVYDDDIVLAVNVALATGRPLLVRGESGTGKSTLARNAAHVLGRRLYESVITSRSQARDLLYEIDVVARLRDAQAGDDVGDLTDYLRPGPLWWAFDRRSAARHGTDPCAEHAEAPGVVLIDEIDKADPDVPNNLLVPLGSLRFDVDEIPGLSVVLKGDAPLVVITTNEERALPTAFLRRCVELELEAPKRARLEEIGVAHKHRKAFVRSALDALFGEEDNDGERPISPAEFVDLLDAAKGLAAEVGSEAWRALEGVTIWKHGRARESSSR